MPLKCLPLKLGIAVNSTAYINKNYINIKIKIYLRSVTTQYSFVVLSPLFLACYIQKIVKFSYFNQR